MAGQHDVLSNADEAEFAGYVDSGMWELEEWLEQENVRKHLLHFYYRMLWQDLADF